MASIHKDRNHLAIEIAPARLPVKHEHDFAIWLSLVDVVHAEAVDVEKMGLIGEVADLCECLIWCSQDFYRAIFITEVRAQKRMSKM